jgi:alpha-tubulin N-acetyltransferase 1
MEFPFRLPSTIGAPPGQTGPYIGCLDDKFLRGRTGDNLMTVLDTLGKKSAVAQGLKKPVTFGSVCSLLGQRIYLMVEDRSALGFIKVGTKRLFVAPPALHASRSITDVRDALKEINPVCVLDFYVHESCQRTGLGRRLFDAMLEGEGVTATQLAYDKPSNKFLPFLRKHFGLSRYQPQNNNFVIFDEFFHSGRSTTEVRGSRSHSVRRGRSGESASERGYSECSGRGVLPTGLADPTRDRDRHLSSVQRPPLIPSPTPVGAGNNAFVDALPWTDSAAAGSAFAGARGEVEPVSIAASVGSRANLDLLVGNMSSASSGRSASLGSNSRPPLGPSSLQRSAVTGGVHALQTPWGTLADIPTAPGRHRRGAASMSFAGEERSDNSAAGMPSGGKGRSVSVPSRGQARTSENPLTGYATEAARGLGSSGGSVTSGNHQRYASPLSHAGSRMLAL